MTDQTKFRSRYPHASAEQETTGEWGVWDMDREEQKRVQEKFWPEVYTRGLFGIGYTEEEAWAEAVRALERREGRS